MDSLFRKSDRLLGNTSMEIIRDKMDEIHWNAQLVSIMGAKGVGKSTLIKQYLKRNYKLGDRRILYCSADTVDFSTRTLVGLAEEFVIRGGEVLVVDEIHKYKPGEADWSREVKEIYELFPELKMIVSGSSLLRLKEGDADLSRRAVKYTMPGLSFREALRFYHGLSFPKWSLEDILTHPYDLWQEVTSKCKAVALFKEYLENGVSQGGKRFLLQLFFFSFEQQDRRQGALGKGTGKVFTIHEIILRIESVGNERDQGITAFLKQDGDRAGFRRTVYRNIPGAFAESLQTGFLPAAEQDHIG